MARIGQLLVGAGLLTVEQVEQALRAQVMWGGRLGTNLIELGSLDLEALSSSLGRQHRMPPALQRHFDKADRELQLRLPGDVAERFSCVPLLRVGAHREQVAIACLGPLPPRALAIIAEELCVDRAALLPAIAAELRIRYHLERVYRIPRGTRFLRTRGKSIPPFPHFEIAPVVDDAEDLVLPTESQAMRPLRAELVDPEVDAAIDSAIVEPIDTRSVALGDEIEDLTSAAILDEAELETSVPTELPDEVTLRAQRRYVRTIADEPAADSQPQSLGRIAIKRVAMATDQLSPLGNTIGEATRAIRRSHDRDRVADYVIATIDRYLPGCAAAMLLVVRGETAIGWKGFNRSARPIAELGVPLDAPGLLAHVLTSGRPSRAPATDLGEIDRGFVAALGARDHEGELLVVPVAIGNQVLCLLALVTADEQSAQSAESIAAAAGAAFARLMRDASR